MRRTRRLSIPLFVVFACLLWIPACRKSRGPAVPEVQLQATLDPHPSYTNQSTVRISGRLPRAGKVWVKGVETQQEIETESSGRFAIDIPLVANRLNRLQFIPRFRSGAEGLALTTQITQDSEAPEVWIDTPSSQQQVAFGHVHVSGRLSDRLIGSEGLSVTVNGIAAIVEVGIGTNGTFLAKNIPLEPGPTTRIEALATDVLGNVGQASVTVERPKGPGARVAEVMGDCQTAMVGELLPEPIAIRLQRTNGTPFEGKTVTFSVVRSDGRLSSDGTNGLAMVQQVQTNAGGWATLRWKLGSDAGCGNNRVLAHSEGVGNVMLFASARRNDPKQINIGDGNNQKAEVRSNAPLPLVAWVSDGCNGVPEIPVTFMVHGSPVTVRTGRTGHARITYQLSATPGPQTVEANFPGNPGLPAVFTIYGIERDPNRPTSFEGLVLDNAMQPLAGATCRLRMDGAVVGPVESDINGRFLFSDVPGSGLAMLQVMGETVDFRGGPSGVPVEPDTYPHLMYETQITRNASNSLPTSVLLPALDPTNRRRFDNTECVTLTVAGIEGLEMTIFRGSMRVPDPDRPGEYFVPDVNRPVWASLNQVHSDDVPMPMPDGAAPPFSWTLQPAGAVFDPPVRVKYPNMTGLPPGSTVNFLSFDHDTEKFEIVASGRICEDGSSSVTDPGSGIGKAGWGCQCPPYAPTGRCKTRDCDEDPVQTQILREAMARMGSARDRASQATVIAFLLFAFATSELTLLTAELVPVSLAVAACVVAPTPPTCAAAAAAVGTFGTHLAAAKATLVVVHRPGLARAIRLIGEARGFTSEASTWIAGYSPRCPSSDRREHIIRLLADVDRSVFAAENFAGLALEPVNQLETFVDTILVLLGALGDRLRSQSEPQYSTGGEIERLMEQVQNLMGEFEAARSTIERHSSALHDALRVATDRIHAMDALIVLETAVVRVSGQSGGISQAGAFNLGNVPASSELVRGMAVLRTGAETWIGQSSYFRVGSGQVVDVPLMRWYQRSPPIVEALGIEILSPILRRSNATTQATPRAHFSDGTVAAVPGAEEGTTYVSSNPAVATVSDTGVVTAISEGAAFITARNEGVAATAGVLVAFGALTDVEGYVEFPDGTPAANAQVETSFLGQTSTDARGYFLVTQRPADRGPIDVTVSLRNGVIHHRAERLQLHPRANGRTDAGVLQLQRVRITTDVPVCDNASRKLRVLDASGVQLAEMGLGFTVAAMARDASGDVILAGDQALARVQLAPSLRVLWLRAYPGADFQAVAISPDGYIWVLDQGPGKRLLRTGADGLEGRSHPWFSLPAPSYGTDIAISRSTDSTWGYMVAIGLWHTCGGFCAAGVVSRLDPESGAQTTVQHYRVSAFGASPNGDVWIGDWRPGAPQEHGKIWRMDARLGGAPGHRVELEWLRNAWAFAFRPDGHVLAASTHFGGHPDVIFRVEPGSARYLANSYDEQIWLAGSCGSTALWFAGDGSLWVPRPDCHQMSIMAANGGIRSVDVRASATRGDPSGYTQALIIHPDADFDEDGMTNRDELLAGRNPFVLNP
jgi:hypothetical protein